VVLHDYALYKSTFTLLYFICSAIEITFPSVRLSVCLQHVHVHCAQTEDFLQNPFKTTK